MNTLSRHDNSVMLLEILQDFIQEMQEQFKGTDEYENYKPYLDDSFEETLRIVDILKEKAVAPR